MALQTQIQTYASCTQATFPEVLQRYRTALTNLGCHDEQVLDWVTEIHWPKNDDDGYGDVYAAPVVLSTPHAEPLMCEGIEISLYTQPAIPSLEKLPSWVGFNLLIDTDLLHPHATDPYTVTAGVSIWNILRELVREFPEVGAYLTDEWQDNQTWRVISEGTGDPWIFEIGIFPRKLSQHFEIVPSSFKGTVVDGNFGFAQSNRWQQFPWEATSDK
jgi:hypothetical protein